MEEERYLLRHKESNDEDEWTESSESESYYSSDSSIPEWEPSIDDFGRVYFVDCNPFVGVTPVDNNKPTTLLKSGPDRKSTRGKFLRLIRRQSKRRSARRVQKSEETSKVTFREREAGETKEVIVQVLNTPTEVRLKFGRNGNKLIENVLGIAVGTLSDGERVMIAGFTQDCLVKHEKNIKIGDHLKSINDVEVDINNIDEVLEQISAGEVKIVLQQVTDVEVAEACVDLNEELNDLLLKHHVGVVYVNLEQLTENGVEFEEIIYAYPRPYNKSALCLIRGALITLQHLIKDTINSTPQSTSILIDNKLIHIAYTNHDNKLMLLMVPDYRLNQHELSKVNTELNHLLRFTYPSIDDCFNQKTNHTELDHFFSRFFARTLCSGLWSNAKQTVYLRSFSEKAQLPAPYQFEELHSCGQLLCLPVEARLQIDEALNELEASDYRDWNDDPLDCQRLFTIIGSALYHQSYLLASHFLHTDLIEVSAYCRQQGIFHLIKNEEIKSLIVWREVFPSAYAGNPTGSRQYLLLVGSRKDLLAVLMEAGGCTEPAEDNLAPDAFYVEEAQATLAHLQELGVPELAERVILSNPGRYTIIPEIITKKKFLANINFKSSAKTPENVQTVKKTTPEVQSILKNKSDGTSYPLEESTSDLLSEDSVSQGGYSERSGHSDEHPVMGRRAMRDHRNSDDDSDIDDYRDGSQISGSSIDISELRQSLLNESGDLDSVNLTIGAKPVLFHFVQMEEAKGMLIVPPYSKTDSKTLDVILNQFRASCQCMHELFAKNVRFKNLSSEEMAKSVINKSLIAIKECGAMFETLYKDECTKKGAKITYWVVGRLFHLPQPREVYVCHQDNIPQNVVEIAFKLATSMYE